jgi:hypothetical protein
MTILSLERVLVSPGARVGIGERVGVAVDEGVGVGVAVEAEVGFDVGVNVGIGILVDVSEDMPVDITVKVGVAVDEEPEPGNQLNAAAKASTATKHTAPTMNQVEVGIRRQIDATGTETAL